MNNAQASTGEPLLVEDLLLLMFQPSSRTIAGENYLYSVLGGAVVVELALRDLVEAQEGGLGLGRRVGAQGDAPDDAVLRRAWDYVAEKPRGAQTVIAAVGPQLRADVLDRLVDAGHLRRTRRKVLGLFPSESLELADDRRDQLLAPVRATLVDGAEPDERTAALTALLSASGTLPQFHREIPWSSDTYHRGKRLEDGSWGAMAAASAVRRATLATITGALAAATAAGTATGS